MKTHDKYDKKDKENQLLSDIVSLLIQYDEVSKGKNMKAYTLKIVNLAMTVTIDIKKHYEPKEASDAC